MGADDVNWAEGMPSAIKTWIRDYYSLADMRGEQNAQRFSEHFTESATMIGMGPAIHGSEAIFQSRLKAWDGVESRKHTVFQTYKLNDEYSDILVLGKLASTFANDRSVEMEFAAQIQFSNPLSDAPRANFYKVWADKRLIFDAMASK